jgi:hypothetical protein
MYDQTSPHAAGTKRDNSCGGTRLRITAVVIGFDSVSSTWWLIFCFLVDGKILPATNCF